MIMNDIDTRVLQQREEQPAVAVDTGPVVPVETPSRLLWRRFFKSRVGTLAALMLLVLTLAALAAPLIAPQDPYDLAKVSIMEAERAPGAASTDGAMTYVLGTDGAGRDMLSAILYLSLIHI